MCDCDAHKRFCKAMANWVINDVMAVCHREKISIEEFSQNLPPARLRQLVLLMMDRKDRVHIEYGLNLTDAELDDIEKRANALKEAPVGHSGVLGHD